MKLGINRAVESFDVGGQTFDIRIVPVHAHYLIVQHDSKEGNIEEQVEITYDIVSDILEANGYEFDRDHWEKYLDYTGFIEFITSCMAKDHTKKKQEKLKA